MSWSVIEPPDVLSRENSGLRSCSSRIRARDCIKFRPAVACHSAAITGTGTASSSANTPSSAKRSGPPGPRSPIAACRLARAAFGRSPRGCPDPGAAPYWGRRRSARQHAVVPGRRWPHERSASPRSRHRVVPPAEPARQGHNPWTASVGLPLLGHSIVARGGGLKSRLEHDRNPSGVVTTSVDHGVIAAAQAIHPQGPSAPRGGQPPRLKQRPSSAGSSGEGVLHPADDTPITMPHGRHRPGRRRGVERSGIDDRRRDTPPNGSA